MLEREFSYYKEHHDSFIDKHKNEYVVIKGENILGFYGSEIEAIRETLKTEKLGTFLVQQCTTDDQVVEFFSNRVSFG